MQFARLVHIYIIHCILQPYSIGNNIVRSSNSGDVSLGVTRLLKENKYYAVGYFILLTRVMSV